MTFAVIAWLASKFCAVIAMGRATSKISAMPMSAAPCSANNVAGCALVTSVTTCPMKIGIIVSRMATMKPATNRATNRGFACLAKCQ